MKETKKFLVQKFATKWIEENPELIEAIHKVTHEIMMFQIMWGLKITFTLENPIETEKGRTLGKEIEKL